MTDNVPLKLWGGWTSAFVPVACFLAFCVTFFIVFKAFDLTALAMGGFLSLLIGALFARPYARYWDAVIQGIGSPTAVTIIVILFVIGMFAELIKVTNVSAGFVWLADQLGISGAAFAGFTFLTVCVVAMATGSSIGTMFTAFPIFYPAGVMLGADAAILAGAIVSGAIFGDNLAPISDTTIISSSTQRFRTRQGTADIGGVVRSRAKYALVAAAISAVGFFVLGGGGESSGSTSEILQSDATAKPLIMLVPVAIMLGTALWTRDIFKAITVGLVLGTLTGLFSGLISPSDVLAEKDNELSGFLLSGVNGILGTVALVISVFGIMGVLNAAGVLDRVVDALLQGRLSTTPRGAEVSIAVGSSATTVLFGGVNSAAMVTFGPVVDEIGSRVGLHPYRRANVMDCMALGLSAVIPFLSAYLYIGALLTSGYDGVPSVSVGELFPGVLYPLVLTLVMVIAIATGWGRRFEGPKGSEQDSPSASLEAGRASSDAPG